MIVALERINIYRSLEILVKVLGCILTSIELPVNVTIYVCAMYSLVLCGWWY